MALPLTQSPDAAQVQPEHTGAQEYILRLYQELLHRAPGAAELADWVAALLGGTPPDEVRDAFIASQEYQDRRRAAELQAAIAASGLFDAAWYLDTYPDVASAGLDPLEHYCRHGRLEHRAPNAYFDALWYRVRCEIPPDATALLDYIQRGEVLGHAPGPDFDPAWYIAAYRLDAGVAPLAHFLRHRHSRRVAPCPHLWSVAGLSSSADAPAAADPFQAFLGASTPLEQAAADVALLRPSGLFDQNYYLVSRHDVLESGMDALLHYCAFGWKEAANPNFYFNGSWYLATNPDAASLRVNPLVHYLLAGESADRRPVAFFEPRWYCETYDLPVGASPLAHYLAHRHTQRFSPNSLFDPAWYLAQGEDRLPPGRDPFAHYLVAGMHQDVRPSDQFDAAAWRRRTVGRATRHFRHGQYPERDNPLVHYMLSTYK